MSRAVRQKVALLGLVPPDVRTALEDTFELLDPAAVQGLDEAERLAITHGLTSAMGGVDPDALAALPSLTDIASVGAGMDRFDLAGLSSRGVAIHNTAAIMVEDVAECAIGLIFAVLRNVVSNDRFVREGAWASARAPLGSRLSGRKVGIVGLGRIGGRVAEKLGGLGCDVSYTGRGRKDVPWSFLPDLSALAQVVDVLVLTCAGGAGTKGIIDADVLRQLGPKGFLVNVSRGSVVDEAALIGALKCGHIAGAALDVFEGEPNPDQRFLDLPNCVLSPHSAVYTQENRRDLIAEIKRLLEGRRPMARFGS